MTLVFVEFAPASLTEEPVSVSNTIGGYDGVQHDVAGIRTVDLIVVAAGVIHRGSAGPNAQIGAPADLRQVNLPAPELVPLDVAPRLDRLRAGSGAGSGCEGYRGGCVVIGTWVSRARLLMRLLLQNREKKNDRLFAEAGNRGTFNPRGLARPDMEHASLRGYREG